MSDPSKKTTVYFEADVHQSHKAVRLTLREDQEDLSAFSERTDEPTLTYEELLEDLKAHGKI